MFKVSLRVLLVASVTATPCVAASPADDDLSGSAPAKISREIAPFGIRAGDPVTKYGGDPKEFADYVKAPNPHPDLRSYLVHQTSETGVCLVRGRGSAVPGDYDDDRSGAKTKALFAKLQDQITRRYGEGRFSETFSFFDPGLEWSKEIAKKERFYQAVWDEFDPGQATPELTEIILYVEGDTLSSSRPFIQVQYRFSNHERCRQIRDGLTEEDLDAGASKF